MCSDTLFRVTTFLTLLCFFTTKIHCATIVQSIYRRMDVSGISSSSTSVVTNVRSLSQCAALCLRDRGCGGVEFEAQSQTCTLRGWPRIIYSDNTEMPRKVWVNGNVIVFFATRADGSDMTYSQAEELCSNIGARVPTPQEMYDALDAGLNECRCGWTKGGIIRLVIQQADTECPNTNGQFGVLSCKWINTAADTFYVDGHKVEFYRANPRTENHWSEHNSQSRGQPQNTFAFVVVKLVGNISIRIWI